MGKSHLLLAISVIIHIPRHPSWLPWHVHPLQYRPPQKAGGLFDANDPLAVQRQKQPTHTIYIYTFPLIYIIHVKRPY